MIVGIEQRHLPPDQLRVLTGAAHRAQVCHLSVDFGDRVLAVGPHPVSLATVVAGSTGQVAAGKHAVGSLTTRRAPTQELSGGLDVVGELLPAPRERCRQLRLDRPCDLVEPAPAAP